MKQKEKREQENDPQHYITLEMLGEGMQMSHKNTTVTKVDLSYDVSEFAPVLVFADRFSPPFSLPPSRMLGVPCFLFPAPYFMLPCS